MKKTFSKLRISEDMRETTRGRLAMLWRWRSSSKSSEISSAIVFLSRSTSVISACVDAEDTKTKEREWGDVR